MSDITTIEVVNAEGEPLNPVTASVTVIGTVAAGPPGSSQATLVDGDYGDITVSGSGDTWTIDTGVVTPAKLSFDPATQAELDAVSGAIPSTEAIQDLVGAMLTDSATVDFTYDDTAGTFTAVVQGLTSGSLSDFAEAVRDRLGATLVAGTGITVTVDDPGDTVTIATTVTQYTDEMARDAIGAALVAGTNITITPDDTANTITIDATGGSSYTDENAQDAVGTILADSATIDFTYTDATPEITAVVKDGSITAAKVAADVATQAELDAKVSDTAYDATSWNGVTDVAPSKNAVRDELEATATEIATAIADGDASTLTSAQTYADGKVSDTAFAGSWDAVTNVAPSKNAVYDKVNGLVDDTAYDATSWNGDTTHAPSKNAVRDKIEALGSTSVPIVRYAHGDGSGAHTTTSGSLADIASAYSLTIPAVAGDVLEIEFSASFSHSNTSDYIVLSGHVSGTGDLTVRKLVGSPSGGLAFYNRLHVFHVVQSGDITSGNVTVKPRWLTSGGTATCRNEGSLHQKPTMAVKNWRQ